jgi:ABC-type glycerol-3-phosphate transport system permease component
MATTAISGAPGRFAGTVVAARQSWARRTGGVALRYALLLFFLLVFLVPFLWIWGSALKTSREIARDPFALPSALRWENLEKAWTVGRFDRYIGNSLIYCVAIVGGGVALSCLAGYALALLPLPGRNVFMVIFLLGLMVPFQSVMIPIYYLLQDLNLLGTYWAFIIPGIALRLPFGIFLMRGFFRGLPTEIADAARVDGANEWGVFRQIMLPLARPGLATLVVFQAIYTWSQFAMPLIFVQRDELRPVSLGTLFFFGRFTADRGMIAAGVTISMLPVVVLYLILQRKFIEGITAGALKT